MKNIVKSLKEVYADSIKKMQKDLNKPNVMQIPRIEKVVINTGIGRITKESDKVSEVYESLATIAGQAPIKTKVQKSIAGFKVREGQDVGIKVTLRGMKMWDFLTRLINISLPRIRDFRGLKVSTVDSNGNLNIGITDHTVFPEIIAERVKYIFGLQVTVVTTAKNKEDAEFLFRELGFPLKKSDKNNE